MFGRFRKRLPPFVGTWVLVRAGQQPPQDMGILSMRMVIAGDGTLSWESQMRGPWDGMTLRGKGAWLADGRRLTYAGGERPATSVARVEGSRPILDPDFVLMRDGGVPVIGVYERAPDADPAAAADRPRV